MSPITHLLGSWTLAAVVTRNPRDCRLVALAGVLPDLDGAGLLVDLVDGWLGRPVHYFYLEYHHVLLHGLLGGLVLVGLLTAFGRDRLRVALWGLGVFHLHVLCDFVGSRGPDPTDLWSIPYWGSLAPAWTWAGQWRLDAWPNRLITLLLLFPTLRLPCRLGHSVVGVFNRRADTAVVAVLRRWFRHPLTDPGVPG